jgi:hypothetical protein
MKLVLISCCGPKMATPAAAQDIYVSDLFKKSRAYAEAQGGHWAILSAKLGLVLPEEIIEPYNLTLAKTPKDYREEWDARIIQALSELPDRYSDIKVLAGKHYLGWVKDCPTLVSLPLDGLGIGQRLQFLKRAVWGQKTEQEFSLF